MDSNLSFLGIMRKAGALGLGAEAVYDAVEMRRAKLVLLAADVSANTEKSIRNTCRLGEISLIKTPYTKEQLGVSTGYAQCGALAVLNTGFAQSLAEKLGQQDIADGLDNRLIREKRRLEKKQQSKEKRR